MLVNHELMTMLHL
uniref:Uncharacterized protein n=1 Tax=Arundo donax TaxID=35708 RepID=A0A0A9GNI5_ARUDO